MAQQIPYKTYLDESEMPKQWYNLRADMKNKPAPLLNPATLKPMTAEELSHVFCDELVKQELDDTTPYFDIPEDVQNFYKMYRWYVLTAWKKHWVRQHISITSLRAITPPAATSSTVPLRRLITPRSRV